MNIEKMGVTFVRLAIDKTDYLVSNINENDREPSWDGNVEVYRKPGNTHRKEDLILKVPVQVKGHVESNLKKKSITYPVSLSDLRNYLNEGGTTFLVVYVDPDGAKSQIYYKNLLPYDLRRLVRRYGEQKTKNIDLKALPSKKNEIAEVLISAATHMQRQRPAITCEPVSIEDLIKQGHVPELSIGYTRIADGGDDDPLAYLFDHDTYVYAKFPYGLELPVEYLSHIDLAGTTLETPVSVTGHVFYSQHEIVHSKDTVEYHFGKSTKLIIDKKSKEHNLSFLERGTLSQRITDMSFILQAIEAGQFEIGDQIFPLTGISPEKLESFDIPQRKAHLAWLEKLKILLDKLCVTDELDCDCVSPEDELLLAKLVASVLEGKSINWTEPNEKFPNITLANLTIKLCVIEDTKNEGYFRIFDYSHAPIGFRITDQTGQQTDVSYHVFLKRDSMLKCCNIDYSAIIQQINSFPISEVYSGVLVWLLLEMLCAYDESEGTRQDILAGATALAEWLRATDPYTPQDLLDLNFYQTAKRSRELSPREIQGLHSIIESKPARADVYVGAYSLLGDYASARYHYDRMDKETQNTFDSYPISRFLPKL